MLHEQVLRSASGLKGKVPLRVMFTAIIYVSGGDNYMQV